MITIVALALAQAAAPEPGCAPGFHLVEGDAAPRPIAEKLTDHRKMGNLIGASLFGGMLGGPMTVKTVLTGPSAAVRTKAGRPSFLFCTTVADEADAPAEGGAMAYVGTAKAEADSPRAFRLVRFDAGSKQREAVLTGVGTFNDPAKAAMKAVVRFEVEELGPGQYRVTPLENLAPGEYGFMRTAGNTTMVNGKKAVPERVFDFAVD
jgi:hypothetical protein